ncbi:hypothetical protein T4B_1330 [Trichinella pseudospiralis]|uniref:Uncharacterized protein n=2 Tax=Trichinella pseudospiralis TaxID=6337 RepID=A0A0V1JE39_TRIPS|nr:hypothetical protein T4D_4064 [Trichinella pseudospiralis]KRZ26466.1 hypothetical protein T4B_1330 [Trichinella pseudospiralis]KRZ33233.1 hypothetical protein T4C_5211 [Trichinella pseudospiralis]
MNQLTGVVNHVGFPYSEQLGKHFSHFITCTGKKRTVRFFDSAKMLLEKQTEMTKLHTKDN